MRRSGRAFAMPYLLWKSALLPSTSHSSQACTACLASYRRPTILRPALACFLLLHLCLLHCLLWTQQLTGVCSMPTRARRKWRCAATKCMHFSGYFQRKSRFGSLRTSLEVTKRCCTGNKSSEYHRSNNSNRSKSCCCFRAIGYRNQCSRGSTLLYIDEFKSDPHTHLRIDACVTNIPDRFETGFSPCTSDGEKKARKASRRSLGNLAWRSFLCQRGRSARAFKNVAAFLYRTLVEKQQKAASFLSPHWLVVGTPQQNTSVRRSTKTTKAATDGSILRRGSPLVAENLTRSRYGRLRDVYGEKSLWDGVLNVQRLEPVSFVGGPPVCKRERIVIQTAPGHNQRLLFARNGPAAAAAVAPLAGTTIAALASTTITRTLPPATALAVGCGGYLKERSAVAAASLATTASSIERTKEMTAAIAITLAETSESRCGRKQVMKQTTKAKIAGTKRDGVAADLSQAGALASSKVSCGKSSTVISKWQGSLQRRSSSSSQTSLSRQHENVSSENIIPLPQQQQQLEEAPLENDEPSPGTDTIYALSSMGDTVEFTPAALAVWRISGPLAFLVLRLLMAKPLSFPQSAERRIEQPQKIHTQEERQAQQEDWQHPELQCAQSSETQGEKGGSGRGQRQLGAKRLHTAQRQWRSWSGALAGKGYQQHKSPRLASEGQLDSHLQKHQEKLGSRSQLRQLPFLLRPLPEERVATFVHAWDCLGAVPSALGNTPRETTEAIREATTVKTAAALPVVPLDDFVVLRFTGPRSFTGEDVVEVHSHGSRAAVSAIREFFRRVAELVEELQRQEQQEEWQAEDAASQLFEEAEEEGRQHSPLEQDWKNLERPAAVAFGRLLLLLRALAVMTEKLTDLPGEASGKGPPSTLEEAYSLLLQTKMLLSLGDYPVSKKHLQNSKIDDRAVDGSRCSSSSFTRRRCYGVPSTSNRCRAELEASSAGHSPLHLRGGPQGEGSQHQQELLKAVKAVWLDMQGQQQPVEVLDGEKLPTTAPRQLFPGTFRSARRGEFSLRAFVNGKLKSMHTLRNLAALVTAENVLQHRGALQRLRQPPQQVQQELRRWQRRLQQALALVEGCVQIGDDASVADSAAAATWAPESAERIIREVFSQIGQQQLLLSRERESAAGLKVVICGPPNAGKSTLFNALVGRDVAIVSGRAGTTRDVLSSSLPFLNGKKAMLFDTAGLLDQAPLQHEQQKQQPERQSQLQADPHSEDHQQQQQAHAVRQQRRETSWQEGEEEQTNAGTPAVRSSRQQPRTLWMEDPLEQESMLRAIRAGEEADVLLLMIEAHASAQQTVEACRSFLRCFVAAVRLADKAKQRAARAASLVAAGRPGATSTAVGCRSEPDALRGGLAGSSLSFGASVQRAVPRKETACTIERNGKSCEVLLPRVKQVYLLLNKAEQLFSGCYSPLHGGSTSCFAGAGMARKTHFPTKVVLEIPTQSTASQSFQSVHSAGHDSVGIAAPAVAGTDGVHSPPGVANDASTFLIGANGRRWDGGNAETETFPHSVGCASLSAAASTLATLSQVIAEELPVSLRTRVAPVTQTIVAGCKRESGSFFTAQTLVAPITSACSLPPDRGTSSSIAVNESELTFQQGSASACGAVNRAVSEISFSSGDEAFSARLFPLDPPCRDAFAHSQLNLLSPLPGEQPHAGLVLPLSARSGWNLLLLLQRIERDMDKQQDYGLQRLRKREAEAAAVATANYPLSVTRSTVGEPKVAGDFALWPLKDDGNSKNSSASAGYAADRSAEENLDGGAPAGHFGADEPSEETADGNIEAQFTVGSSEALRLLDATAIALRRALELPTSMIEEKAEELREALKVLQILTGDAETGGRQAVLNALLDTFCVGK